MKKKVVKKNVRERIGYTRAHISFTTGPPVEHCKSLTCCICWQLKKIGLYWLWIRLSFRGWRDFRKTLSSKRFLTDRWDSCAWHEISGFHGICKCGSIDLSYNGGCEFDYIFSCYKYMHALLEMTFSVIRRICHLNKCYHGQWIMYCQPMKCC